MAANAKNSKKKVGGCTSKPKVASKAAKGYIYKDRGEKPVAKEGIYGYKSGFVEIETSPLYFRYDERFGPRNDPRAYINSVGMNIVNLMENKDNDRELTKKMREFSERKFRDVHTMIKYYNDCFVGSNNCIKYADGDIVANDVHLLPKKEAKEKGDRHIWNYTDTYRYVKWKNNELYSSVIIDVPGAEYSPKPITVDSKDDVPKGTVLRGPVPNTYPYERHEEYITDELRHHRPSVSKKFDLSGYNLKEDDVKKYGVSTEDMRIGDTKHFKVNGSEYSVKRTYAKKSSSAKSKSKTKSTKKRK